MIKRLPSVPGVADIGALLNFMDMLSSAEKAAWLKEAKQVAKDNWEAATVLGSPDRIKIELSESERKHREAQKALDDAKGEHDRMVSVAQDAIARLREAFSAERSAFESERDQFTAHRASEVSKAAEKAKEHSKRDKDLNALQRSLDNRRMSLDAADAVVAQREAAAEKLSERADAIIRKAKELV